MNDRISECWSLVDSLPPDEGYEYSDCTWKDDNALNPAASSTLYHLRLYLYISSITECYRLIARSIRIRIRIQEAPSLCCDVVK